MIVPVGIFLSALALIVAEKFDRTKIALVGAGALLLTQTIDQEQALEAIHFDTLGLLAGMMIVVRLTEATGVYTYIAIRAGQLSRGRPFLLVIALAIPTAVLSAFLDNLTTILLMVPITFLLADAFDIDPIPLILIEVMACNIGGTATLIGDPPNIMIASATGLSFMDFVLNVAPIAYLTMFAVVGMLYLAFRRRLRIAPEAREKVMELNAARSIEDPAELKRLLPLLGLTVLAFFVHKPLGLEPATVALCGATAMLAVTRQSLQSTLGGIEWPTLFFFVGLFVMVGALEHSGAIDELTHAIVSITDGERTAELLAITWSASIVGGIVDNIPLTATMIPVVDTLEAGSGDKAYWWALSLGACFGGNLTIISAAANVAAAGMASRAGSPIGFVQFLRVGIPVTLFSTACATVYLLLRYT
ncbi:ArsB/NhaD family transporter [Conexibacter sp. JD483]|uniref:SLC13 family permease n=1 Tax=unclassified Conexibacter TaxID=2627773 RepID=UPI002723CA74|nr:MULTISPECIES: ArsB/NhaD family transporter [unclassified Conexibacter]MDO8187287.1 ArsB/NhaD family transporter [Conexibacter sp. CPCC 205706]MDO8198896.1 ArsB/NhaD family transporter [Conexibacter sp. CPCC 205762]MDR9370635.1 ArsB/NhaD family transporter [Conexibacter sp. JD483]